MLVWLVATLAAASFAVPASAAPSAPTITASPSSPGQSHTATWSFTGGFGETLECRVSRGLVVVYAWSPCTSPASFDLAGQPDGGFAFDVRARDAFGALGPVASSLYVLDTTAPAAPTFAATPAPVGADPAPTWSFSAAPGAPAIYDALPSSLPPSIPSIAYAARSTAENGDLVAFAGTKRYAQAATVAMADWSMHSDWPGYPAGAWQHPITLNLYEVDRSGATPAPGALLASVTQTFDIPWRPEPDPTCTGSTRPWRDSGGVCRSSIALTVDFDLTGQDLTLPDEVIYGVAFNTAANGAVPIGTPGPYDSLNLGVTSAAPAVGADVEGDALYHDSTFPGFYADGGTGGVGIFRHDTGWIPYTPAVQVAASDPPGPPPTIQCRLTRGGTVISGWAACPGAVSYDLSGEPDGTYTLAVRATDAVGNAGPETTFDYTLSRPVPGAPSITSSPTSPGAERNPSWSFTADAGALLECRLTSGGTVVSDWTACASPASFDLSGRPDGAHRFEVRARNALGILGPTAADDYEFDATPPAAPTITAAPDSPGQDRSPSWSFTAEAGATLLCRLERGLTVLEDWTTCSSPRRYDLTGKSFGVYRFAVRGRDAAGNLGAATFSDYELARADAPATPSTPSTGSSGGSPTAKPGSAGDGPPLTPNAPTVPASAGGAGQPLTPAAPVPTSNRRTSPNRSRDPAPASVPLDPLTATPRRSVPAKPAASHSRRFWPLEVVRRAVRTARHAVGTHPERTVFPPLLLLIVGSFLAIQGRIDRSDPKLALAPVYPDPDFEFPLPPLPA